MKFGLLMDVFSVVDEVRTAVKYNFLHQELLFIEVGGWEDLAQNIREGMYADVPDDEHDVSRERRIAQIIPLGA